MFSTLRLREVGVSLKRLPHAQRYFLDALYDMCLENPDEMVDISVAGARRDSSSVKELSVNGFGFSASLKTVNLFARLLLMRYMNPVGGTQH